jgi:ribonuclease R
MPKHSKKRANQGRDERRTSPIPRTGRTSGSQRDGRGGRDGGDRRRGGGDRRERPPMPAIETARIIEVLAGIAGGGTAGQLAALLKLPPTANRELGQLLRRLVEQGQVMEARPGRYQVSGAGGEHSVIVEAGEGRALIARFPDEKLLPIHPRHAIGARPGDVCQAMIGEDDQVLVTRILRRAGREVVGTVNFRQGGMAFIPDNRREGEMEILSTFPDFQRKYQAGDRVLGTLAIDAEGKARVNLTRILGDDSPEIADFTYACLTHDLPGPFPEEVEREADDFPRVLSPVGREDLRKKLVFTIDPKTAKDFDDAISLEPRPGGGWILGVHIADVSHYVREETALDGEAAARGTSIYLINRVIPMLPEELSNGLCSLVPRQDRYCLSVFIELDAQLRMIGKRMAETLIHSRHRLTYEEAMHILIDKHEPGKWPADLVDVVKRCGEIAQGLRKGRERAGALNLYSVEHRFSLDVNGMPIEVGQEVSDQSHQLIEECMLLANRAVAEWLESKGFPCVYRIHAQPDAERLKVFAHILEVYGIDSSGVYERFGLQRVLKRLEQEPRAARLVLNFMCLRSFKKAVYGIENIGHYALAFASYAHFTSPIRRYPDLLVHRLAKRALGLPEYQKVEMRLSYLDALAKQASGLEQRAAEAERTLHARKSARYLAARIGESFPGVVTGATGGGLFVQMLETGMEGMVPVRELRDDYYEFDPERLALVGSRSGRVFGPGVEIDVVVIAVDIDRSDVMFGFDAHKRPDAGLVPLRAKLEVAEEPVPEPAAPAAASAAPASAPPAPASSPISTA